MQISSKQLVRGAAFAVAVVASASLGLASQQYVHATEEWPVDDTPTSGLVQAPAPRGTVESTARVPVTQPPVTVPQPKKVEPTAQPVAPVTQPKDNKPKCDKDKQPAKQDKQPEVQPQVKAAVAPPQPQPQPQPQPAAAQPASAALPKTGPAQAIGLFFGTSTAGFAGRTLYLRRKR